MTSQQHRVPELDLIVVPISSSKFALWAYTGPQAMHICRTLSLVKAFYDRLIAAALAACKMVLFRLSECSDYCQNGRCRI